MVRNGIFILKFFCEKNLIAKDIPVAFEPPSKVFTDRDNYNYYFLAFSVNIYRLGKITIWQHNFRDELFIFLEVFVIIGVLASL